MLEVICAHGDVIRIPNGQVGVGLLEDQTYLLDVSDLCDSLLVDDIPLDRAINGNGFVWRPGFFAGRVEAESIDADGRTIGRYQLDVGATPDKLGQARFQLMVDELLAFRPELLLGTEPAQSPFDHDGAQTNPEIEYARLKQFGAACIRALQIVCIKPLTSLRQDRRIVMLHQARCLDAAAIRGLGRSPGGAAVVGQGGDAYADGNCRISVPSTEPTVDNAANRAMAAIVDRLLSRIAGLMDALRNTALQPMNPVAPKVGRRLAVLGVLRNALRGVRRSPTLGLVTRTEITAAALNAISAHPDYAHAYQLAWKALRGGIQGEDVSEFLPIRPTWEIYERWCFLQIIRVLERLHPSGGWKLNVGSSVDAIHVRGVVASVTVEARLQATFRAWDVAGESPFKSLSGERIPDIILTADSTLGRRFLVLDAKYRATRPNVLDAMQSAHLYRDALLWKGEKPWMSLLLIPRRGAAAWLEVQDFQDRFRVGTVEAAESKEMQSVEQVIERFLADECDVPQS